LAINFVHVAMQDKSKLEKPERPEPKSFWYGCYEYPEWCLEWLLYVLSKMAIFDILDLLSKLGVIVAVILFFSEAKERQQRKQYEAWQVIINMQNKSGNGGRITAIEDLNTDGVSLSGIEVQRAYLSQINLKKANLQAANFSGSTLYGAIFERAKLYQAKFICIEQGQCTDLYKANFQKANLEGADLRGADSREVSFVETNLQNAKLQKADLQNANFQNANLKGASLECAKGLTSEQVKLAKSWQSAIYDQQLSKQLGLSTYSKINCLKLKFNPSTKEWEES
jgi:hypothetical protein